MQCSTSSNVSVNGSDRTLCIDSSFKLKAEAPSFTAQERVRNWLHESSELKVPASSKAGSFLKRRSATEVVLLSEEEAEMYLNDAEPFKSVIRRNCLGIFSCFPLKDKRQIH
jgi:hypothetical protein